MGSNLPKYCFSKEGGSLSFLHIFEAKGKVAEFRTSFPILWLLSIVVNALVVLWILGGVAFGDWFNIVEHIILFLIVGCVLVGLCSVFWMAAQPNRSVAVLPPWAILKDKFSARRLNDD